MASVSSMHAPGGIAPARIPAGFWQGGGSDLLLCVRRGCGADRHRRGL